LVEFNGQADNVVFDDFTARACQLAGGRISVPLWGSVSPYGHAPAVHIVAGGGTRALAWVLLLLAVAKLVVAALCKKEKPSHDRLLGVFWLGVLLSVVGVLCVWGMDGSDAQVVRRLGGLHQDIGLVESDVIAGTGLDIAWRVFFGLVSGVLLIHNRKR